MNKLITAKINLDKIKDDLLFDGEKGTYLNLSIWINKEPDKYGNEISIQQTTKKDEPKIYLGEGKFYVKKEDSLTEDNQGKWRKDHPKTDNIEQDIRDGKFEEEPLF